MLDGLYVLTWNWNWKKLELGEQSELLSRHFPSSFFAYCLRQLHHLLTDLQ